ncbi:MAG: hypothetical protein M3R27_01730 [Bacteroidota bacterium]|nr:hypothetical protein [Bacteroidota bacterium]
METKQGFQQSEEPLLLRLKQGDQKALGNLYDLYAAALLGVISRIVENDEIAEKVLQRVFLKIWSDREKMNILRGSFFIQALNLSREEANQSIKKPEIRRLSNIVNDSEKEISSKCILELIYLKGYTYLQAAKELGITAEQFKEKVQLAVKQLKGVACNEKSVRIY